MPNFIQINDSENRIKDVGNIENCVIRLLTSREQKQHSLSFHVIYAVIVCLLGYISMDGITLGTGSLVSLLCMFAFPALYAYITLFSPGYLKAVCTFSPFILFCLRSTFFPAAGEGMLSFAATSTGFLMCLAIGAVMSYTAIKKKTKLWCLVAVTVCVALCLAATFVFAAIFAYGSFNITDIVSRLNEGIESFGVQVRSILIKELSRPGTLELYKAAFPEIADLSISEIALTLSKTFVESAKLLKNLLPSIFILLCMIYGFIFVGTFSVVSRIHRIPLYICIVDNRWCYRVPKSCITFFDIVLLFAIIDSFISLPQNIGLAIINLLIILVPIVTICTFKAIFFFLYGKLRSKAAGYGICAAIAIVSTLLLGFWGYLLLCSIGVTFVAQRYRIECELAKTKILKDIDLMLVLCGCKQPVFSDATENASQDTDINSNNQQNMSYAENAKDTTNATPDTQDVQNSSDSEDSEDSDNSENKQE